MRFAFSEDQLDLVAAVRGLLASECAPAAVLESWSSGWSRERWGHLSRLGVPALAAPESFGGLGADETTLVAVLEECGRAALPEPAAQTAAVAVPALAECAPGAERDRLLGSLVAGEALAVVATVDGGFFAGARGGDAGPLHVPGAARADLILLVGSGEVRVLERDHARITETPSLDGSRPLAVVEAPPGSGTRVAGGAAARAVAEAAFERASLGCAAELLGVSDRLIHMAAQHARDRHQFGRPIGSFQAVKHLLADALLRLEFARPLVYRAAWSVATGASDLGRDVSMAKAAASDSAELSCRAALQVHGAIGYTWEHDLHLWLKRGWSLARQWGDSAWHRSRVARSVLALT